jgi:accessory gene regulator B
MAHRIKAADPEGIARVEVMAYALGVIFNVLLALLLTIIFGAFLNNMGEALAGMLFFAIIRYFSGGYHLRSLTLCSLISALLFAGVPLIPMNPLSTLVVTLLAALLFLIFAPNFSVVKRRRSLQVEKSKLICVLIVLSNVLFLSPVASLIFLSQGLLIIPGRGGEMNDQTSVGKKNG